MSKKWGLEGVSLCSLKNPLLKGRMDLLVVGENGTCRYSCQQSYPRPHPKSQEAGTLTEEEPRVAPD